MKTFKLFFLFLLITLFFSGPVRAAAKTEKIVLENGLTIILTRIPQSPLISIYCLVKLGPLYETPGQAGISNLTLKMLLKGTKKRSAFEIIDAIESTGGLIVPGIEPNLGYLKIVIHKKHLEAAVDLLAELLREATFPEDELAKTKEEIINQFKEIEDSPEEFALKTFYENFYAGTSYSWPLEGRPETILKISPQDLKRFRSAQFLVGNLVISVAGDLTSDEIKTQFGQKLHGLATGPAAKIQPFNFTGKFPRKKKIVKKTGLETNWIIVAWPAPALKSRFTPALKIIETILAGGMNSRLFIKYREINPIAYAVGAHYPVQKMASHLMLLIQTSSGNFQEIAQYLQNEIKDLQNRPLDPAELTRAKNYFSGLYLAAQEASHEFAYYKGKYELLGLGPDFNEIFLQKINDLKPADIQKASRVLGNPLVLVIEGKSD